MPSKTVYIKNFEISSLNDFLKAIIKDKTILEYKNMDGNDIYLIASYYGHLEIMKYLENEHNWNIHVKNKKGKYAYVLGNKKIKKHLSFLYKKEKEEKEENDSNLEEELKLEKEKVSKLEEELKQDKEKDSNLEEQLKVEKKKNSKLEDELKQIKETLKKIIS